MIEIALSLSGGGYRAAMFHLGVLTYLHQLKITENQIFLENVRTISTISGGSLTGLWYMMHKVKGDNLNTAFTDFYNRLCHCNVMQDALNSLLTEKSTSLIEEMAQIYDKEFFDNETFSIILNHMDDGDVHHYFANGTDFQYGLPFRFQASRKIVHADPPLDRGFIGNGRIVIDRNIAGQIKLSEIMAVSSCFPIAYEPMLYPSSFSFSKNEDNQEYVSKFGEDIQLMDGGIVDDQGIEPILLANNQMNVDVPNGQGISKRPCHDLIIISDASNPWEFKGPKITPRTCGRVSLRCLFFDCLLVDFCILIIFCSSLYAGNPFLAGCSFTLIVIITILLIGFSVIVKRLLKILSDRTSVSVSAITLSKYPLWALKELILNRCQSGYRLFSSIFMSPIRRMHYHTIYEDSKWKNRRITNTIYELSSQYGSWRTKSKFPDWLKPSEAIQKVSDEASQVPTTLWFTESDMQKELPKSILACGQYNICMNLLEYIEKLKADDSNTAAAHTILMECEQQLRADWDKFQNDPLWMANTICS
jgi:predicted acylesterase/phospholipase RssA